MKQGKTGMILAYVVGALWQIVWWLFAPVRWLAKRRK